MAWEAATDADKRQSRGEVLGPLHGVPMTNKDTNETKGMPNTWGSPLLKDAIPSSDSLIVGRLRRAGAILTGKTNVPEFAAGAHTFNDLFGATGNPYSPELSAGGSSGGAAAAIASGIQAISDGSDMGGSLRIPAAFCNTLGLRPSLGRIPSPGANSWAWLGRTGPLAREASDLALMMRVISGPDPAVPLSIQESVFDASPALAQGIEGLRIGWSPDLGLGLPVQPEVLREIEKVLLVLVEAGAEIEFAAPCLSDADQVFRGTRAFDYAFGWAALVHSDESKVKPEVLNNVAEGEAQTSQDLRDLARARTRLEGETRGFFERYDLWLTPTAQVLPFPAEQRWPTEINGTPMGDYLEWMRSVCVVSAMSNPAISVPAGFTEGGLPVGMQFVAPQGEDALLIRVAAEVERRCGFAQMHPTWPAGVASSEAKRPQ